MILSPPFMSVTMPTLDWPYILGMLADHKDDPVVIKLREQYVLAMKG